MNAVIDTVDQTAAAQRRFNAAMELLMSFEPTAEQLTEAAKQLVKIAHRAINPRRSNGGDEEA